MDTMQLRAVARHKSAEVEVPRLALRQEDLAEEVQTVGGVADADEDEVVGWGCQLGFSGGKGRERGKDIHEKLVSCSSERSATAAKYSGSCSGKGGLVRWEGENGGRKYSDSRGAGAGGCASGRFRWI